MILGILISILLSLAGVGSFVSFLPTPGVSVFAVTYLMAQLIERIIEPFSEHSLGKKRSPTKFFGDTNRIKELRQNPHRTNGEEEELSKMESKRVYAFWGLTSLMGIILSYLTLGLFGLAGITFKSIALGSASITGHTFDSILSGIIVGSGTKPVHDLISTLEKQGKGTQ